MVETVISNARTAAEFRPAERESFSGRVSDLGQSAVVHAQNTPICRLAATSDECAPLAPIRTWGAKYLFAKPGVRLRRKCPLYGSRPWAVRRPLRPTRKAGRTQDDACPDRHRRGLAA